MSTRPYQYRSKKAYYHKVKLNEVKWRIDAENYLAKNKHLELQEKI